jgi:hypothetical protein
VSNGAGLLGAGVRGAQLTKNLRLANDHRVEPGGHREQVLHTGRRVVHVEVFGQVIQVIADWWAKTSVISASPS